METRNTLAMITIVMIVFSHTPVLGKQTDNRESRSINGAGLHQSSPTVSSRLIVDDDSGEDDNGMDDNVRKTQKQNKLRSQECFSDASCLRERGRTQDEIHTLQSGTTETERSIRSYLRSNLTDSEKNTTDTQLSAFRNSLDALEDDLKEALRTGGSGAVQLVKDRAVTLYNTYSSTLLPYIDPGKIDTFRTALQTIINNRINKRQLEENRRVLSNQDEDKIEWFIGRIPPSQRLEYLARVLSRVEKLMQNIENSSMNPVRKERFLATLDEIFALIQARIDSIGSGGTSTTPPIILSVSLSGIAPNSATLSSTVDERGTGYYVVLPAGSVMPTALQVKSGQNSAGQLVSLKGSGTLVPGMNQLALTGLASSTSYVVYFTAEDTSLNLQQMVQTASFSTPASDTIPPVLSPLVIGNITFSGARLSVTSNEVGVGYYVLLQSGATAPSALQVKAGQDSTGNTVSLKGSGTIVNGTTEFTLWNLATNTFYTLYLVAEDTSGNRTSTPVNVSFTTLASMDTTPPVILGLSLTGTTSSGTTLLATVSESGTGHSVILLSGSPIPSATQVRAGQDGFGQVALTHGNSPVISGINMFSITGLAPSTSYILYFTAEDTNGNLQSSVQAVSLTTMSP